MRRARSIATLGLVLLLCTCSDGTMLEQETGQLSISVSLATSAITSVVVEVTAPDIPATLAFNLTLSGGTASGTLSLPPGANRTITVRGFDAAGVETHRGSTTVTVAVGTNTPVSLTILPLGGSVPIIVTVGNYAISVAPALDTVVVNDTIRFAATVTAGGPPLNVSPVWASLNPATATVDANGIVRGLQAGSVTIVASYGGVAASAGVLVTTGGGTPGGIPACLNADEIALIDLVNQARADSGRAPLTIDTRLIQTARKNAERVRDELALDSVEFGGLYGLPGSYPDFGWGFGTPASVYSAWTTNPNTQRQQIWAVVLGTTGQLIGVVKDTQAGVTQTPRWVLVVNTSTGTPVTNGSCIP